MRLSAAVLLALRWTDRRSAASCGAAQSVGTGAQGAQGRMGRRGAGTQGRRDARLASAAGNVGSSCSQPYLVLNFVELVRSELEHRVDRPACLVNQILQWQLTLLPRRDGCQHVTHGQPVCTIPVASRV